MEMSFNVSGEILRHSVSRGVQSPTALPPDTFADDTGRAWRLHVSYAAVKRLQTQCGFDVTALPSQNFVPLDDVVDDDERLLACLKVLLAGQMAEAKIEPEQLDERMSGPQFDAARFAFAHAVFGSFREPVRLKGQAEVAAGRLLAQKNKSEIDAVMSDVRGALCPKESSEFTGASPESSACIPATTA